MRDSDLLSKINDGVFFESIFGPERDWDAALDVRDAVAFDSAFIDSLWDCYACGEFPA
ncbi:hypothetical protein CLU93_5372 [Janthinobacterium sp. 35]|uniref:hypothetical protein n=1 Tax=Janthinobacterium sp. 35 TaxID=2035210 RepID=UPI000C3EDEEE|nr:hypothetical protein [Janthinobacterium sp. 35]PIG31021.1 hypothetical protein CLU93_5372 [Janthinobacterium sp. 35]